MLQAISRHSPLLRLLPMLCGLLLLTACAQTGVYHTVQPGQTLYRIAKTYDVEERVLMRVNRISDPTTLRINEKLFIPGATQLRRVPVASVAQPAAPVSPSHAVTQAPPAPVSRAKEPEIQSSRPTPPKSAAKSPAVAQAPAKGSFIWPAKGTVLNKFGKNGQNTYKGIEIGLKEGTPVVAAAAGKVIFSGNAIRGYGNLVILEHSDGYFSVYGYNRKNLVSIDDYVGQGDKIALSGSPPNGQSPRLHFEIRQGKGAVDPIFFLP